MPLLRLVRLLERQRMADVIDDAHAVALEESIIAALLPKHTPAVARQDLQQLRFVGGMGGSSSALPR